MRRGLFVVFSIISVSFALQQESLVLPLGDAAFTNHHESIGDVMKASTTDGRQYSALHVPDVMDKVQDTVRKIKDAADAAIVKTEKNAREVETKYKARLNATTFTAGVQVSKTEKEAREKVGLQVAAQQAALDDERQLKAAYAANVKQVAQSGRDEISTMEKGQQKDRIIDDALAKTRENFDARSKACDDERDAKLVECKLVTESEVATANEAREKAISKMAQLQGNRAEHANKVAQAAGSQNADIVAQIHAQTAAALQAEQQAQEMRVKEESLRDAAEQAKLTAKSLLKMAQQASNDATQEQLAKISTDDVNEKASKSTAEAAAKAVAAAATAESSARTASDNEAEAKASVTQKSAEELQVKQDATRSNVALVSGEGRQAVVEGAADDAETDATIADATLGITDDVGTVEAQSAQANVQLQQLQQTVVLAEQAATTQEQHGGRLEQDAEAATRAAQEAKETALRLTAQALKEKADEDAELIAAEGTLSTAEELGDSATSRLDKEEASAAAAQAAVEAAEAEHVLAQAAHQHANNAATEAQEELEEEESHVQNKARKHKQAESAYSQAVDTLEKARAAAASTAHAHGVAEAAAVNAQSATLERVNTANGALAQSIEAQANVSSIAEEIASTQEELEKAKAMGGASAQDQNEAKSKVERLREVAATAQEEQVALDAALRDVRRKHSEAADEVLQRKREEEQVTTLHANSTVSPEVQKQEAQTKATLEVEEQDLEHKQAILEAEKEKYASAYEHDTEADAAKAAAIQNALRSSSEATEDAKATAQAELKEDLTNEEVSKAEQELTLAEYKVKGQEGALQKETVSVAVAKAEQQLAHQTVSSAIQKQIKTLQRASNTAEFAVRHHESAYEEAQRKKEAADGDLVRLNVAVEDAKTTAQANQHNPVAQEALEEAENEAKQASETLEQLTRDQATAKLAKEKALSDSEKINKALEAFADRGTFSEDSLQSPVSTTLLSLGDADDQQSVSLDTEDMQPWP